MRDRVSSEGFGRFSKAIRRQTMRNDQNAVMDTAFVVELQRKADKVVAVPRYKTALFQSSAFELLEIRKPFSPGLVNTKRIHSTAAEQFGNPLAQIFVEVKAQSVRGVHCVIALRNARDAKNVRGKALEVRANAKNAIDATNAINAVNAKNAERKKRLSNAPKTDDVRRVAPWSSLRCV